MKQGICYVVGAGEFFNHTIIPTKDDYVIAADGGFNHLMKINIHADILMGDLDSVGLEKVPENTVQFPPMKDDTDMMIALKHGLSSSFRNFRIYGGTGGRIDHTLANIQLLTYLAEHDASGYLYGSNYTITVVKNNTLRIPAQKNGYVSVFSHTDTSTGVYERGLKYTLTDAVLTNDVPLGVSNEFIGEDIEITVNEGILVVLWYQEISTDN